MRNSRNGISTRIICFMKTDISIKELLVAKCPDNYRSKLFFFNFKW